MEKSANKHKDNEDVIEINFDKEIIDKHIQKYPYSCIPSCVEMVLKLLNKVNLGYYKLQDTWKNNKNGSFHNFDKNIIKGITFHHEFNMDRGADFPIEKLTKRLKTATSFEELSVCSERLGLLNKKYLEKEVMHREVK